MSRDEELENKNFLLKLRQICLEYDKEHGRWPENVYEGCSVYNYAVASLTDTIITIGDSDRWYGEIIDNA